MAGRQRRAVVVGGGHNGLVCAAYLARAGLDVRLIESRPLLGGACVTEELWPGYRVSRGAYVLSLLRPAIVEELGLLRHGLALLPRVPSSFTPLPDGRSLVLGPDPAQNQREVRKFSAADAERLPQYEALLERIAAASEPLLDRPPPRWPPRGPRDAASLLALLAAGARLGAQLPQALRVLLGPARELLEEWFESEPLRGTLATDAVIGAFASPASPGTGYVLFHHVMGSLGGARGVWAYVRGGMGALCDSIAAVARAAGVQIRCGAAAREIQVEGARARGVLLESGEALEADVVVSSLDPARSLKLLSERAALPEAYRRALGTIDYRSPVFKMNLALRELPRFRTRDRESIPLSGTIHLGAQDLDSIERAYRQALAGQVPELPLVELTLPSSLDDTIAPAGRHLASIFAQYAPALPQADARWPDVRAELERRVLDAVEAAAPGFRDSIEHCESLAPPDLERVFGLTGGNIFHGAMTPDRLWLLRPTPGWARHATPIRGLYLCGSGTHPGGGVMGAPGRNAARLIARA